MDSSGDVRGIPHAAGGETPEMTDEEADRRLEALRELVRGADARADVARDGVSGSTEAAVEPFRRLVWEFYEQRGRKELPWRRTTDPYGILVSEVMLQQTQVSRALERFTAFLAEFPDVHVLADATLQEVLRAWRGLGYNRRAAALHRAARRVVEEHGGVVPRETEALLALPGVGPATAAAVASFAYGIPTPYLETNVRALVIHVFFPEHDEVHDRDVRRVVGLVLDRERPREWHYALMDLGVLVKRIHPNPGRRSAHHRPQARFEGSLRQARGRVIATLVEEGPAPYEHLEETAGIEPGRLRRALDVLVGEGLIEERDGAYRIA